MRFLTFIVFLVSLTSKSQTLSIGNNQTHNTSGNSNYSSIVLGNNSQLNVINNHVVNNTGNITSNNGIGITISPNATLNVVGCLTGVNNLDLIVSGTLTIGCVSINNNGYLNVSGSGTIQINGDLTAGSGTILAVDLGGELNVSGDVNITQSTSTITVNGDLNISGNYNGPSFSGGGTVTENGSIIYPIPLPVELINFYGNNNGKSNVLYWTTSSEYNNSHFTLYRSNDGVNWVNVSTINGSGYSTQLIEYTLVDYDYQNTVNYYKLIQYDLNGIYHDYNVITIDNSDKILYILKTLNINGQEIDDSYVGPIFVIYSDGTTHRMIK